MLYLDYGGSFFPLPEVTLLSVYLRLCWVFVAAQAVSSCGEQGLLSLWRARAPCWLPRVGSLQWPLWLQSWALGARAAAAAVCVL